MAAVGSHFSNIGMPEAARLWSGAGLSLLFPGEPFGMGVPAAAPVVHAEAEPRHAGAPQASTTNHKEQQLDVSHETSPSTSQPQLSTTTPQSDAPRWNATWDGYLAACPPEPKVLFTYWELTDDMGAAPSAARRELWGSLLGKLPWPKGYVGFLPLCEPDDAGIPRPAPDLFWRGVTQLGVGHVVVFGRRAMAELFPARPYGCKRFRMHGVQVTTLPGPHAMLADGPDGPQAKRTVWSALAELAPGR